MQRKHQLLTIKNNIKLGDVFVVDDKIMGNSNHKPRLVVAKINSNKVNVIPVRKGKNFMILSKFDNDRILNIKNSKKIPKNILYEKQGFKNTKNSFLTNHEKTELEKKAKRFII